MLDSLRRRLLPLLAAGALLAHSTLAQSPAETAEPGSVVREIADQAEAVLPMIETPAAQGFLAAALRLPHIEPRTLWRTEDNRYLTRKEMEALGESERAALKEVTLDERFYYMTRYGTPVAYARALDLYVRSLEHAGPDAFDQARILDFGYGGIGHLRMLATLTAEVVGVEVDPLLQALYSWPGDHGLIGGVDSRNGMDGSITLVHGQWPADQEAARTVNGGYDLIISKNVLKNGYIHPEKEVDPRRLVHLGVDDPTFLRAVHDALVPGGRFLIYNLCPPQNPEGEPYIPWADGRCPFSREEIEAAGLRILSYNEDDSIAARQLGRMLGWADGERGMNLETDLFAEYTIIERPAARAPSLTR